jgi:recombination protein RecR
MASLRSYPAPLEALLSELRRLPGVGPKSAERLALWLLGPGRPHTDTLADSLRAAAAEIRPCARCGFFAVAELCPICADESRGGREICVVEQATDILPLERTGFFRGRYHALGGKLAPLEHVGPEQLRIAQLLERIPLEHPTEIILALSADVEGGATTSYLAEVLRETGVKVTRVAHGLPAGGGLEHADALTLQSALNGRMSLFS